MLIEVGLSLSLVWVANVIPRPPAKRSAAIAIVNGCGNLGTLYVYANRTVLLDCSFLGSRAASYVWKLEWGPDYHPSMFIGIAMLVLATVLAFGMLVHLTAPLQHV